MHTQTKSDIAFEIITPFARRLLSTFAYIVSAYVLFVFAIDGSLHFLWALVLVLVGLFSLFFYTKPQRRYYTPLIFTLLYFLGYLFSIANMLMHKDEIPLVGWGSIGDFEFTDIQFFPIVVVICAGMLGIVTATLITENIFTHRNTRTTTTTIDFENLSTDKLQRYIGLWFCFSICLILLMWKLEIGRTGLLGITSLPFKMVGLMVYLKKIFVPFCGLLFLDLCLRQRKEDFANVTLALMLIVGTIGALGGIGRGMFVFTVFPAILFLLFTTRRNNLSRKLFFRFSAISIGLLMCVVFFVGVLRNIGYSERSLTMGRAVKGLRTSIEVDLFKTTVLRLPFTISQRTGGMKALLAVSTSGIAKVDPFKLFMGDKLLDHRICYSVYGFNPTVDGVLAFGTAYGMWGQLFLSNSYFVVYFGTILVVVTIICFEEVFIRKGIRSVALLFSMSLGFGMWGGPQSFFLLRYIAILFICYFAMLFLSRSISSVTHEAPRWHKGRFKARRIGHLEKTCRFRQ